ncbi:GNAT family N-acetyltransferase [Modestobacter roseus]|uniref:RimJ/RimL family protein N-acetyltransferase n=1 Tax=Modestobacter roseus TaxID=1181884 RepID=A0A562ITJ4_9ACTN|nr:GNAT family N-acetyltransferase [Modestobacter roseus]MQA33235.1 GNAT family N-acetyltransferase [Modestobacter roseus]TWH74160.1 RimJ/RimL family protein N-acetyltransferase [Modestobacter roseus]
MLDVSGIDLTTEVVRTERLVLRPYRPDDVDAVLAACQDPDIGRWIPAVGPAYGRDDAVAWVTREAPAERAAGTGLTVAIEADGEFVGSTGVHRIGQHPLGPEVGYWIAAGARGRGYAAEAAHAMAEWALGLGASRVYLVADVGNTGSQSVARRAGFTQEGVLRSYLHYADGRAADAALFSRLPGD